MNEIGEIALVEVPNAGPQGDVPMLSPADSFTAWVLLAAMTIAVISAYLGNE